MIDIEGNNSNSIRSVYAGNDAMGSHGNVNLGDQVKISVKNSGSGFVNRIQARSDANITVGDGLYLDLSGSSATSDVRGVEVGLNLATAKLGSNATIIVKSDGSICIWNFCAFRGSHCS